jgi:hypothetical protein
MQGANGFHTAWVVGSNPTAPTIKSRGWLIWLTPFVLDVDIRHLGFCCGVGGR